MRDYFKFEVQYIMNITDIDDKVIFFSFVILFGSGLDNLYLFSDN